MRVIIPSSTIFLLLLLNLVLAIATYRARCGGLARYGPASSPDGTVYGPGPSGPSCEPFA
jgi:hypothetical protein